MIDTDAIIKDIIDKRDRISALNAEIEELQTAKAKDEAVLMQAMRELNLTQMGSAHGTASMKVKQSPVVQDWAALSVFILNTGNLQLLQKRISGPAFTELVNAGDAVPGIELFEQDTVSIRRK